MIFFLGSLEMSAPILSGCKRKGKREGGLKRILEAGGAGRKGGGGVAAEIYTALQATKKTCLLTLMLLTATSGFFFREGRATLWRDERRGGTS